jgi:hypothetical protein
MSNKRLDNTIFIMYLVSLHYCKKHNITIKEFAKLDDKYNILGYVEECPDVFDCMSFDEMVDEIDEMIREADGHEL